MLIGDQRIRNEMIHGNDHDHKLIEDLEACGLCGRERFTVKDIDQHEGRPEVIQEKVMELEGLGR